MPDDSRRLTRMAELAVGVGANVQPGQLVVVYGLVENAPLAREIARAAYRAGARIVEPFFVDGHFTRALVELGPEESLGVSAPWDVLMIKTLADQQGALIQISGEHDPDLMAGLDGDRIGRSRPQELIRVVSNRLISWTVVPSPTAGWAKQVFSSPDVEALWSAVETAVRLDQPDPVGRWRAHVARLERIAEALTERRFDSLRYRGPGTDFTVGLLPSSRWVAASAKTVFGQSHVPNLPTEEVFTSPDKRRRKASSGPRAKERTGAWVHLLRADEFQIA